MGWLQSAYVTDFSEPTAADVHQPSHDLESLLGWAMDTINSAKSMPLSNSVIVSRDEMLQILQACVENLPTEIRQANWMLRERSEFLAKMEREGDEILDAARERAERMVQRSELVREAQRTAQRTLDAAEDEARQMRHEAEDYCDQKLAEFEIVLSKTIRSVQLGREKLQGSAIINLNDAPLSPEVEAFFDQDRPRVD